MTIRRFHLILIVAVALAAGALATSPWRRGGLAELPKSETPPPATVGALPPSRAAAPTAWSPSPPAPATPPSEELVGYAAIGYVTAENLHVGELHWTEAQFDAFVAGLRANFRGASFSMDENSRPQFEAITRAILAAQTRGPQPKPADNALGEAAKKLRLQPIESGLFVRIMRSGTGPRPRPLDTVVVTISARALNGTVDLKPLSAEHVRIKVANLMPGLAEGVQMLALGGAGFFLVPPELSFGDGAWPAGVERGTPLTFIVELHDVIAADAAS